MGIQNGDLYGIDKDLMGIIYLNIYIYTMTLGLW